MQSTYTRVKLTLVFVIRRMLEKWQTGRLTQYMMYFLFGTCRILRNFCSVSIMERVILLFSNLIPYIRSAKHIDPIE